MFKYKDNIFKSKWITTSTPKYIFKYRFDPVPFTGYKKSIGKYFKYPKTTQEKRKTFEYPELIRGKRSFRSLPDAWNDIPHKIIQRNWKRTKKQKQWM